jgi:hypothetical protein
MFGYLIHDVLAFIAPIALRGVGEQISATSNA